MQARVKPWAMGGCAALAVAAAVGCAGTTGTAADAIPAVSAPPGSVEIVVLSSRPDLVSGNDARIEIRTAGGVDVSDLRLALNGQPLAVTPEPRDAATLNGVVTGLKDGSNWLQAIGPDGVSTRIELVSHPLTGPILSGPHLSPYECRTAESGLGDPTDENCSAPTRIDWFYRSTDGAFKPLESPSARPADLATATTIEGEAVPYTVRVESGVINRSIYRIAILGTSEAGAVATSGGAPGMVQAPDYPSWNGRLAVTFGGGCGTQYNQGQNEAVSVLNDMYLSRGFAFVNSTELVNQQHCNQVLQGETLMMLKEHFIERYGVPKWTVGTGGSGGAIQQQVITQMYPGLLDGLQPSLAYPDSTMNTADCGLLQRFWKSKDGQEWSQEKKTAVEGYTPGTCAAWERSFVRTITADDGCALSDESLVYNADSNPKGARCTTQEMRANIYGRDPETGFALRPIDNVGLQYGLKALNDGAISVSEFLTLNERVGGNDIDGGFTAERSVGDIAAIEAAYQSGFLNTFGGGISTVPVINYRPYTDAIGDIHDRHRDLTIRARIEKANGRSDNQVIWVGPMSARGANATVNLAEQALDVMTQWLDAMAADPAPLTPDKVAAHKPAAAVDAYFTEAGEKVAERASWDVPGGFNSTYPVNLEPRLIAGAPLANDVMKCQLKPVDFAEYKVSFTAAQQKRMTSIFPSGVCDWSKPGVGYSLIRETYRRY